MTIDELKKWIRDKPGGSIVLYHAKQATEEKDNHSLEFVDIALEHLYTIDTNNADDMPLFKGAL